MSPFLCGDGGIPMRVENGVKSSFSLLIVLIMVCPASAQDEARVLLDKAAKGHGGKEKLARIKGFQLTCKGSMDLMGLSVDYTQESTIAFSGKVSDCPIRGSGCV